MSYSTIADYSQVTGVKNLPFLVELDVPNCVFEPAEGGNQKFCYKITAKSGVSNAEDMEYCVLGIDEGITPGQIKNISVAINGSQKTVRFNTSNANVILNNSGLIFDFVMSKSGGNAMVICFELTSPYDVGPIAVSLFGQNGKKTGLTIGGPCAGYAGSKKSGQDDDQGDDQDDDQDDDQGNGQDDFGRGDSDQDDSDKDDSYCCKHGQEDKECFRISASKCYGVKVFELSVPVTIKPFVITHKPEVRCLGELKIEPGIKECCQDCDSFDFTLSQKISVKTPLEFIVNECCGELCVEERKGEDEIGEFED